MDKKNCKHCGMLIAKQAVICPHCMKQQKTKIPVWVAIVAVSVFALLWVGFVFIMATFYGEIEVSDSNNEQTEQSIVEISTPEPQVTVAPTPTLEPTPMPTPVPTLSAEMEKEQFKASCNYLDYEDILRNPSNYKRVNCKIDGQVDQIIEGWFGSYSIFIKDNYGNKWGCTYSYKDGESQLLEGDKVTVYGICYETQNTETVLGKQVTMPYVDIKYIR